MRTALTLTLAIAAALATAHAHAAEETRSLAPFSSVSSSGTANVRIEVGKAQSITVSGDDALVREVLTEVVGTQLKIRTRRGSIELGGHDQGVRVTITLPRLTAFEMGGAGESVITHMSGDSLDVTFGGAGSLTADGSVHALRLNVGGVGAIDTRNLHADTVDASVGGVGSVDVWAGTSLAASVGGVGSLTYYGNPRTVHTSGGGLGSISRAK
ncbi:MAG: DUF2807 domain-containing protein [Caulobacter sp.]|nr:DUF2807 domain-containing protein [Vitreoscilla sp.]